MFKIKKSLIVGLAFACVGVAHAASSASPPPAYALSNDLKTTQQWTENGEASPSFAYTFQFADLKDFPLHGLTLGSALPARCGAPSVQPCSIALSKDPRHLFVVTGLKASPQYGVSDRSALVVTNGAGTIVGIGQPMSSRDEDVHQAAVGLRILFGDPTTADQNSAWYDRGGAALSLNRTVGSNGATFSLWLYEKDAFPVVSVPFVAGETPIENFKRWSDETATVK